MILHLIYDKFDFKSWIIFFFVFLLLVDMIKNKNPSNFHLRVGSDKIVIISGYKMVKEALNTQNASFVERPNVPLFHKVFKAIGISLSNGYLWRSHRKFAAFHLRMFGEGKKSLEHSIHSLGQRRMTPICNLINIHFFSQTGTFNPLTILNGAVSNIVACLIFGQRFNYHDECYQRILRLDTECVQLMGSPRAQLYNVCPQLLEYLPGPHQTIFSNYKKIANFLRGEIIKHKEDWDPSNPRDLIDNYLTEMEKVHDPKAGFNIEGLVITCLDVTEAGTETTATTLRWGLLFMIKYPETQRKVQEEIDRVIGQSRQPYNYLISGTAVSTILSSVLHDPNEWKTPDTFNPGHFLTENVFSCQCHNVIFNFALWHLLTGKRACLGEQLARQVLFLFFTSLLQQFTISKCPGEEPSLVGEIWFTYVPAPYRMCVSSR
uniref:Cytochrome P450, family 2, subfamily AD, polypeptide 2 n=1 Tax=Sinocyclocheilus grahami TaxID=75366 RepID=A0A672QMB9_SINGR